ncbi:MAG: hypothetical protein ABI316_01965 [Casimicrobiaceae bacterium]
MFASKSIDRASLATTSSAIGALPGEIRNVHLDAQLEQAAIPSDAQSMHYRQLRGYANNAAEHHHRPQ